MKVACPRATSVQGKCYQWSVCDLLNLLYKDPSTLQDLGITEANSNLEACSLLTLIWEHRILKHSDCKRMVLRDIAADPAALLHMQHCQASRLVLFRITIKMQCGLHSACLVPMG